MDHARFRGVFDDIYRSAAEVKDCCCGICNDVAYLHNDHDTKLRRWFDKYNRHDTWIDASFNPDDDEVCRSCAQRIMYSRGFWDTEDRTQP